jgi:hypothetical protein
MQAADSVEAIARQIQDMIADEVVFVTIDGIEVRYELKDHRNDKVPSVSTTISAQLPPGYPLELFVRRHALGDRRTIAAGRIDVKIGDPTFDDEFLVEAAPADVVKRLLDEPARELLWPETDAVLRAHDGVLRLAFSKQLRGPAVAAKYVLGFGRMAARVRTCFEAADAAAERGGDPYRAFVDDTAVRKHADRRLDELAALTAVRDRRRKHDRMLVVVIAVVVVGLLLTLRHFGIIWADR